jgi:SAM-dependent methyltransferase
MSDETSTVMNTKKLKCPICANAMQQAGTARYYDESAEYRTPIFRCASCDLLYRDVDNSKMISHYYVVSYTQEINEENFRRSRTGFFKHILSITAKYAVKTEPTTPPPVLVDFGSAYGHLLEAAGRSGFRAVGVELNKKLVSSCRDRGLNVCTDIGQVPDKADVVLAIDSLYCVSDIIALTTAIRNCLKPNGLFLARVTNRNLYARFISRFIRPGDFSTLGDAIISYSKKSLVKLIEAHGFRVVKVIPDYGRGKRLSAKKKTLYWLSYVLTLLLAFRVILTPGLIVVAQAQNRPIGQR